MYTHTHTHTHISAPNSWHRTLKPLKFPRSTRSIFCCNICSLTLVPDAEFLKPLGIFWETGVFFHSSDVTSR